MTVNVPPLVFTVNSLRELTWKRLKDEGADALGWARAGVKLFQGKMLRGGGSKNYHKKQVFRINQ